MNFDYVYVQFITPAERRRFRKLAPFALIALLGYLAWRRTQNTIPGVRNP